VRVINSIPFKPSEIETYRQLILANIVEGLRILSAVIEDEGIECSEETVVRHVGGVLQALVFWHTLQKAFTNIADIPDIRDEEVYPAEYRAMFEQVWSDSDVQKAIIVGKQVGLPDKYVL
jgi:hypothetical protein